MENWQLIIDHFGTVQDVTDTLKLRSTMAVYQWKKRGIPPKRAMQIELLTNGKLKAAELIKLSTDGD
jgi:hypothetical protein